MGSSIFSLAMAAAFLFGYLLHFVIDSPDLYSNVAGPPQGLFFHSALSLAIMEFVGFFFGAYLFIRGIGRERRGSV